MSREAGSPLPGRDLEWQLDEAQAKISALEAKLREADLLLTNEQKVGCVIVPKL